MRFRLFTFYFAATSVSASLCYVLLRAMIGNSVFGALTRMFVYHWQHPFQYIALACFIFSVVAAVVVPTLTRLAGWRRALSILVLMLVSIVIASIPGGILWSIHDMQAGYFPSGERFLNALGWGAFTGLQIGWYIILLSFPYNILGLIAGYFIINHGISLATSFQNKTLQCRLLPLLFVTASITHSYGIESVLLDPIPKEREAEISRVEHAHVRWILIWQQVTSPEARRQLKAQFPGNEVHFEATVTSRGNPAILETEVDQIRISCRVQLSKTDFKRVTEHPEGPIAVSVFGALKSVDLRNHKADIVRASLYFENEKQNAKKAPQSTPGAPLHK